jgi:hypothetical protein
MRIMLFLSKLRHLSSRNKYYFVAVFSVVMTLAVFTTVRLVTFVDPRVHYHANFALYIDGVQDKFSDPSFYEEVSACSASEQNKPESRVHLHENIGEVLHVHDQAATWGALFANLRYTLGNKILRTQDGKLLVDGADGKRLRFVLNGQEINLVANQVIDSEDALVVDYGSDTTEQIMAKYSALTKSAATYNTKNDPSSCTGSKPLTLGAKLKTIFGLDETSENHSH